MGNQFSQVHLENGHYREVVVIIKNESAMLNMKTLQGHLLILQLFWNACTGMCICIN